MPELICRSAVGARSGADNDAQRSAVDSDGHRGMFDGGIKRLLRELALRLAVPHGGVTR